MEIARSKKGHSQEQIITRFLKEHHAKLNPREDIGQ